MNDHAISDLKTWLGQGSINFFGPPFSGKDTQANKVADVVGGIVVSGGDILRKAQDKPDIQAIMAAGGVIPSELFLGIIPPFFSSDSLHGKPLLLSSVGRLMDEVPTVESATAGSGHPIKAVVVLNLDEASVWRHFELSKQRQDRGARSDDTAEALHKRLEEYRRTQPVIEHYRAKGLVIDIDDAKDIDQVGEDIIQALIAFSRV